MPRRETEQAQRELLAVSKAELATGIRIHIDSTLPAEQGLAF
jgi:hypothetical protein